jgi:hypothetical protein
VVLWLADDEEMRKNVYSQITAVIPGELRDSGKPMWPTYRLLQELYDLVTQKQMHR